MYVLLVHLVQALALLPEDGGRALLPLAHPSSVQAPRYDDRGMVGEPCPSHDQDGLPDFIERHQAMFENHIEIAD